MEATVVRALAPAVARAVALLRADGIEGRGLRAEEGLEAPLPAGGTWVDTAPCTGQMAPRRKWVPPAGWRLVRLGEDTDDAGWYYRWYALVAEAGDIRWLYVEEGLVVATLSAIAATDVPAWALARLAEAEDGR